MPVIKRDRLVTALLRRGKVMTGHSFYLPTEAPHFQLEIDDEWYVFCAIHKNASSTIRRLIENVSKIKRGDGESIFHFLYVNHLARSVADINKSCNVMAFVRDPVERVVSCYQNKFIQRQGNRTIFKDYGDVIGDGAGSATFEQFVEGYIGRCFNGKSTVNKKHDRHIYTQHQQLLPVNYQRIALVDQFDSVLSDVGLNHLLPKSRENSTSDKEYLPGASSIPADSLHNHFLNSGKTPDATCLLTSDLVNRIRSLYKADFEAFGHLFDSAPM